MGILCGVIWMVSAAAAVLYALDYSSLCRIPFLAGVPYRRRVLSVGTAIATVDSALPKQAAVIENRDAASVKTESGQENGLPPGRQWYWAVAGAAVIGLICGYFAWKYAISWLAIIKLWTVFVGISAAAVIDAGVHLIPNRFPLFIIGARVLIYIMEMTAAPNTILGQAQTSVLGLVLGFCPLFLVSKLSSGGLGMGDAKLFGAIGFAIGAYGVFYTLFFSLLCSALVGLILLVTKRGTMKYLLPFGPFILAGTALAIVTGLF